MSRDGECAASFRIFHFPSPLPRRFFSGRQIAFLYEVTHPIWLVISASLLKIVLAAITIHASRLMGKARPEHRIRLIVTATGAFLLLSLAVTLIPNG